MMKQITFIDKPRKRERRFLELADPISTTQRNARVNFFRHFCAGRTKEQAIAAAAEHLAQYPHLADELEWFKKSLGEL